eukprot:CAMPEP_0115613684 /NCGR_PEP_ID=MMETSP0272-20121206/21716_1 /TAXON_ID=71861 /ORGANISM="Scrippsiella trochoidea, Strain CCMP3099" /LENGTH=217 /DNA_ID=CAMNT_0003049537 /DNA_START=562 /DNA_END=1217 /DNA_ORIENTATION=+
MSENLIATCTPLRPRTTPRSSHMCHDSEAPSAAEVLAMESEDKAHETKATHNKLALRLWPPDGTLREERDAWRSFVEEWAFGGILTVNDNASSTRRGGSPGCEANRAANAAWSNSTSGNSSVLAQLRKKSKSRGSSHNAVKRSIRRWSLFLASGLAMSSCQKEWCFERYIVRFEVGTAYLLATEKNPSKSERTKCLTPFDELRIQSNGRWLSARPTF